MYVFSTIVQKGGDCKSKFCPRRFWTLLDKAEVELILFSSINRYLGSERMEFACRRSKDNSQLQSSTETLEGIRPLKMSSRKKTLSSKSATRRKLKLVEDLVFLLVSLCFLES